MNKSTLLIAPLMLLIGVGAGYWLFGDGASSAVVTEEKSQPLFYRNPMNPDVTSPTPAKDSMGMDYIPVYAEPRHVLDNFASTWIANFICGFAMPLVKHC